jgi:cytoskeleton protein RodZ
MNIQPDNQVSNLNRAEELSLSVGQTLREARELLGLSVNDVSNRIKFAPRQIEALEEDDLVRLPEAAFVRGFVRSYARLLELDANSLLARLPASYVQVSSSLEKKSVDIPLPSDFSPRRYNIILLSAGFAIALAVAIFMRLHDSGTEVVKSDALKPDPVATVQSLELPNVPSGGELAPTPESAPVPLAVPELSVHHVVNATLPLPATPPTVTVKTAPPLEQPSKVRPVETPKIVQRVAPVSVAVPAISSPQVLRSVSAVAQVPRPVPAPQAVPKPVPNPVQVTPPVTTPAAPANAVVQESGADHGLRLEFDEDAWVEIKDGNDKILTSKMYAVKSLVRLTGKAPLLVVIGNAHAVRLFDGGKKVNLDRHLTADVARIKLK